LASVTTLTRSNAEVVVQEDGKIVTGGIIASEGPSKVLTVRLNDDGSLDDSFNGTGYAATLVRGSDVALTTALQADDKIVQAGFTSGATPGRTDLILTRLNADGTPDTGFGVDGNGTVVTALTTGLSAARAVTVNDDGKIIVVGRAHVAGGATIWTSSWSATTPTARWTRASASAGSLPRISASSIRGRPSLWNTDES
jgi:uncharacterized delta-60 repeat protein